jgi:hypothetical protein
MIPYLLISLVPLGYGVLYLVHSVRHKRRAQAVSIGALLLFGLAASSLLLWEYLKMP